MEKPCPQFYGAVTVSERGQIVIPAQARRDLGIQVGEKLLVIGGAGGALWLLRADLIGKMASRWLELARNLERMMEEENVETP